MKQIEKTGASWAGRPCFRYEEVDSTNEEAKRLARQGAGHGTLVWAECQTAGKGRRGRTWHSPAGANLYMSLLLRQDLPVEDASMVTLVAALAVQEGLRQVCGLETSIKWPNDLVADGKKLCGILTELIFVEDEERADAQSIEASGVNRPCLVVGIGINLLQKEFPEELADRATSVALAGGRAADQEVLIGEIMNAFETYYECFRAEGDLSGLKDLYEIKLINRNRQVCVLDPKGSYEGTALGIDERGNLLVRTGDGSVKTVGSGEVSVRGLYSYV